MIAAAEYNLAKAIAAYLRMQYPNVLFRTDMAGMNLSKTQAGMNKVMNGRGWPDLFIAQPVPIQRICLDGPMFNTGDKFTAITYAGAFLELKAEGEKVIRTSDGKKILKGDSKLRLKGDWWDAHVEEQAIVLASLRAKGYYAEFVIGFDDAKRKIDWYLKP